MGTLYQDSIITLRLLNLDKTYRLRTRGEDRAVAQDSTNLRIIPVVHVQVEILRVKSVSRQKLFANQLQDLMRSIPICKLVPITEKTQYFSVFSLARPN